MRNDTIFSPAFGNRPSYLVGRQEIIREFLEGLNKKPGNRDRAIMLLGQRGSGKTVLLWELADRAREQGFIIANPTVVTEDMLDRIIEKIQDDGERYLSEKETHLTGGNIGVLGFSVGLQFTKEVQESKSFQYKLSHLCRKLNNKNRGILILVDEVQGNSPEIRQLVAAYQELIGEQANIALVMAGLPAAISATLNDHVLTFLNRARKITLGPLPEKEIDAFFAKAFNELGVQISPEERATLTKATFGSPYMLQLVGYNVCLYANDDGSIDGSLVQSALQASKNDFENDVCKTTLAALSDQDIAFLEAMVLDEDMSKMADISKRMKVTPDYAQKYRKRLIDAGVIEAPRRGYVSFAVPYLADYLRQER